MLVSLQNVSFYFGARPILEGANWQIGPGERIGLVGHNGAGKSTVLRLITGYYTPDKGSIHKPKDVTLGFFNQDLLSFSSDASIHQVAMEAFDKARALEKYMAELVAKLESAPENPELLDAYSHALHDFEIAGGYEMEHKTAEVLEGLGFSTTDLLRPYNEFSGGWRMRVLLAKMMLQAPDLLLLDEPTNHLDLPSIEWLERYLQSYPGSVVIVSHDRYFLDRMVTKIVEVFQRTLVSYSGNYTFFQKEKEERMLLQQRAYENQQEYIRQQERFIERFRAKATKAAQAQSAIKRLDKLEIIEAPDTSVPQIHVNFDVAIQPGKIISSLENISKRYGDNVILKNTSAEINRGDKIALIGANGKGKSTLLRVIAGIEPCEGVRKIGHNVVESFYAQHQLEALNVENEVLQELAQAGTGKTEQELRQLLGGFLFSGDDVFKKIKVLSGGEKARVALAKVIAARGNFLMLDEPTNHLDMQSVEMLITALNRYQGTLILVSHDRYFISKTANKIWSIEEGQIKVFPGGYEEWVLWEQEKWKKAQLHTPPENAPQLKESMASPKPKNIPNHSELSQWRKELQSLTKKMQKLEDGLEKLQKEKSQMESSLADPAIYADREKFLELDTQYKKLCASYDEAQAGYDQILEQVMVLEEKIAEAEQSS